jgi:hypothetical protein
MGPVRELVRRAVEVVVNATTSAIADEDNDVTTQASGGEGGGEGSAGSMNDKVKQIIEERVKLVKKMPSRWRYCFYNQL